ncbi:hypothetical protein KJ865_03805 [Myxococcota bacterium]|nr:hypothetical protein [Myxococcota bacterium]MBU1612798.1 hypothetical protein [Pseudomonadota bacterium]
MKKPVLEAIAIDRLSLESTLQDEEWFAQITSQELSEEVMERLVNPEEVFPAQRSVMAIHWHPEFVPLPLIEERIRKMYPGSTNTLVIPTQHNVLVELGDYVGCEVDCYSREFKRKVQLLAHFKSGARMDAATTFRSMLEHTFSYRAGQLFEFLDALILSSGEPLRLKAAHKVGADGRLIGLARVYATRLKAMILAHLEDIPRDFVRNKLVNWYFEELKALYDDALIDHVQSYIREVKNLVKLGFDPEHFYETQEIIEEVRGLGGGIIIPHPEQFWPILLADYDVDGYEVWNPQSYDFTDFLIHVVTQKNKKAAMGERPLLITMGDDCHMGVKTRPLDRQDPVKAARQIGLQPPWEDPMIKKRLGVGNITRDGMIDAYRARLG